MKFLPLCLLICLSFPLVFPLFPADVLKETCDTRECLLYKLIQSSSTVAPENLPFHRWGADLIRENGYPFEHHNVTSADGYITSLFRIPHGKMNSTDFTRNKTGVPVLLHHGFIADGFQWILNSVEKALAYRLADAGFDVWLTNNRGTLHSLEHVKVSWRTQQYWNFSFHEIGVFDVPVIINKILEESGHPAIYYIGHSMGCSTFFACLSEFPEYNSKVIAFIGLAPAVYVGNTTAPFQPARPILLNQQDIHDKFLQGPFISPDFLPVMQLMGYVCSPKIISRWFCFAALELVFGYNFIDDNSYDLRTDIVTIGLSSTSNKAFFHLMQLWKSGKFQKYDYLEKNLQVYGQMHPPVYDLFKVTAPVALYCGADDHLVSCKDVLHLSTQLPNVKEFRRIEAPNFNHIDFLYSTDINPLLNDRLLEIISSHKFGKPE